MCFQRCQEVRLTGILKGVHFACCKIRQVLSVFLLVASVSHPVSVSREFIEASLVAPVTILAASCWIFSNSFNSY